MKKSIKLSDIIKKYKDPMPGGVGDSLTPNLVQRGQLIVGIYVEMEHTRDVMTAMSIVMDHLYEHKDYYYKLYMSGIIDEKNALEAAKKYFKDIDSGFKFVEPFNQWNETDF